MASLNDNAAAGLSADQMDKVLQLQDLTGIDDMSICRDVLQRHSWNLEVAVQEQLNIKEGRPSLYSAESRPPAVVSDLHGQHRFHADDERRAGQASGAGGGGGGGVLGIFGLARALVDFVYNMCYSTILALFQLGRRMIRGVEPPTDPLDDVLSFIAVYEEKYGPLHPVFYQGTFNQVLNDAKRELRFLIIYLHQEDCAEADQFCRDTLGNTDIINFINSRYLFWACSQGRGEGRRVQALIRAASQRHYVAVLVLRDNSMTVVGRFEGCFPPAALLQRLRAVTGDFEISLLQTRADRYEASVTRSLRAHQDEAFQESLRADQEKQRRREREQEERAALERARAEAARCEEECRQEMARQKREAVTNVPSEPDATNTDAIHIVFKLPSGRRLERRFLRTHSLEVIYWFVFCHPATPDQFEITTNFPKVVLRCRPEHPNEKVLTLHEVGLQNREVLFINDLDA